MHPGIMVDEGSKAGGMGSRNRYNRDYRLETGQVSDLKSRVADGPAKYEHGTAHHNGYNSTISSSSSGGSRDYGGVGASALSGKSSAVTIAEVEKRIAAMQHDFKTALHKVNGKDNEKFDLIFAILSELQSRQAQLEETVRSLKAQCSAPTSSVGSGQAQPGQQQFGGSDSLQSYGHMGGQMNAAGGGQPVFAAMPQVLVMPSPTGAAMQQMQQMDGYTLQQLMPPAGQLQPMPQHMAMQYTGQAHGSDYGWGGEGAMTGDSSGHHGGAEGAQRPTTSGVSSDSGNKVAERDTGT